MFLTVMAGVVMILCFISAVNYYFQKLKYKYAPDEQIKALPFLEAPSTWSFFTIILALLLVVFFSLSIGFMGRGLSDFSNQKDTINQYQQDSASENSSSGQSN